MWLERLPLRNIFKTRMKDVRVRFAPSPTGALHIGGVRTALYNYLLARQNNGTMILRIEDTDQGRYVPGAEEYILESLAWAGIKIDEGVGVGGPHAPYRQSERKEIYKQYAKKLVDEGNAYYAFDTEAEIEAMRKASSNAQYDGATRMQMKNALTIPDGEVQQKLTSGQKYVIRLKVPASQEVKLNDLIRGEVIFNSSQLDDKVLLKSDGMPTYHLANVVDDYLMKISHVIRGEEWLPSAPLHVLLYRFLGWEKEMPQFAHLPLLLKPDGNGKLSKRAADQMGFPIFPLTWKDPATNEVAKGFKETGYLPEALINFLAFLGWNPGTEQEIFSMDELINVFSMERINKAGAKFDIQKAQWFNQQYIKAKSDQALAEQLLNESGQSVSGETAVKIVSIMKERAMFPQDIWEQGKFFFTAPTEFDETMLSKKWNPGVSAVLAGYADEIETVHPFTADTAKVTLDTVADRLGNKPGSVFFILRMALTGMTSGPDLMKTMEILGCSEVQKRIRNMLYVIQSINKPI
jgi:glutamyl-tRNA synthetase